MATGGKLADVGFEPYTGDVYGWAYRLLGHHHDALDVVQDVFLRWDAQCRREVPSRPRGWLRRVTVNRAIDLRRQHTATRQLEGNVAPQAEAVPPTSATDQEHLRRDISNALAGLTEMQRSVLVAKLHDDLTFKEIANELGLAISTAKTHYLRAVRAVRDRLEPRWSEET